MLAIRSYLGNRPQITSHDLRCLAKAICLCLNKEDPAVINESFLSRKLGRVVLVNVLFAC
jgi:hypothetical protein